MRQKEKQFFAQQSADWLIGYVNANIDRDIDQFWFARLIRCKQLS